MGPSATNDLCAISLHAVGLPRHSMAESDSRPMGPDGRFSNRKAARRSQGLRGAALEHCAGMKS